MNKVIFSFIVFIGITACNMKQSKYGIGGQHACQFVKEQVPELRSDISNIEVIAEDSIICDIGLSSGMKRALDAEMMYHDGKITRQDLELILDSLNKELTFVENSWKNGTPKTYGNKFNGQWRKVYTVQVTMKSGFVKEPRVLMEQDGVTPRMIEKDFEKELQKYASDLMDIYRRLIYGF